MGNYLLIPSVEDICLEVNNMESDTPIRRCRECFFERLPPDIFPCSECTIREEQFVSKEEEPENIVKILSKNAQYKEKLEEYQKIAKECGEEVSMALFPEKILFAFDKAAFNPDVPDSNSDSKVNYKKWGKESSSKCETCKHKKVVSIDFPCCKCFTGEMWESDEEEINSPSRYNKNGFECIEVMIAIFGKEAVRQFCKLNAFKYIWRESDKGKVNDIKKANYYLKKYVELSSDSSDKR